MARVLVVHDDLAEASRLRRVLRAAGHSPEVTASAGDAQAAAGCDAILVGASCDGGEALAWARRLAADPAAPPAVVLGADAAAADPLPALPAGADAAQLLTALGEALARAAQRPPPTREPSTQRPALARTAEAALRALFGPRAPAPDFPTPRSLDDVGAAAATRDYFQVLGVPRACGGAEARLAADALVAAIDRERAVGDEALAARLSDVRKVVLDAREVLGDDALREGYRRGLGES